MVGNGEEIRVAVLVTVGVRVYVLVTGGTIISAGREAKPAGEDQIAGPFICAWGAGGSGKFLMGDARTKGKTKNKQILAKPCARETPIKECDFSTTKLKNRPTRNRKSRSIHDL